MARQDLRDPSCRLAGVAGLKLGFGVAHRFEETLAAPRLIFESKNSKKFESLMSFMFKE